MPSFVVCKFTLLIILRAQEIRSTEKIYAMVQLLNYLNYCDAFTSVTSRDITAERSVMMLS